jgi:hypothetical protein
MSELHFRIFLFQILVSTEGKIFAGNINLLWKLSCCVYYPLHLLSPPRHRFNLIQLVTLTCVLHVSTVIRPSSDMVIQKKIFYILCLNIITIVTTKGGPLDSTHPPLYDFFIEMSEDGLST